MKPKINNYGRSGEKKSFFYNFLEIQLQNNQLKETVFSKLLKSKDLG
jgi:hypothetical protein